LMEFCPGKIGIVVPTFEEYANRKKAEDVIEFCPPNNDYQYTVNDLMEYFSGKDITSLLLINPDNPSGNYILQKDVFTLAQWAMNNNIRLIVDESFIDFADTGLSDTLLKEEILDAYPKIVVVKSISKSFGVAGLRLGILATHDTTILSHIRSNVSIWNINSFAEFYLQIWEKYQKDYASALEKFKVGRMSYVAELNKISGLRVLPTQANYVTCEILDSTYTSSELTQILLNQYQIFIKDLKGKRGITGDYVRFAVKDAVENQALIDSLKKILVHQQREVGK